MAAARPLLLLWRFEGVNHRERYSSLAGDAWEGEKEKHQGARRQFHYSLERARSVTFFPARGWQDPSRARRRHCLPPPGMAWPSLPSPPLGSSLISRDLRRGRLGPPFRCRRGPSRCSKKNASRGRRRTPFFLFAPGASVSFKCVRAPLSQEALPNAAKGYPPREPRERRSKSKKKKENRQPKGGMGGRHAATTQGF